MEDKAAAVKIEKRYFSPDLKKEYGSERPSGSKVVQPTVDTKPGQYDWRDWALMGGGGLLGYALADSLTGDSEKPSAWKKLIKILATGAGTYGLYQLGKGLTSQASASSQTKKAASDDVTSAAYVDGKPVSYNPDDGRLQSVADYVQEAGVPLGDAAEALRSKSESDGDANSGGKLAFGAGSGAAALAWRHFANKLNKGYNAVADGFNRFAIGKGWSQRLSPDAVGKNLGKLREFVSTVANSKSPAVTRDAKLFAYETGNSLKGLSKAKIKGRAAGAAAIGAGALALWNAILENIARRNAEGYDAVNGSLTPEGRDLVPSR